VSSLDGTLEIKDRIRRYWDTQAVEYDSARHKEHSLKQKDHWRGLLREALGEEPLDILDAGTGTGAIAHLLAEMGHRSTGIDLSLEMLEVAARDAQQEGFEIDYRVGDAERTEFADRSFDAVVSRHLLWTLPHPFEALREWKRLLKPGGILLILDGDWSVPRAEGKVGSLDAYKAQGIEENLPMQKLSRPAADVEMLGRLGFSVTSRVLDLSGHGGSAMRHAKRFAVRGVLPG
jgi:ubiquinone/menaquinone biosynthesis C-methylase UbiE